MYNKNNLIKYKLGIIMNCLVVFFFNINTLKAQDKRYPKKIENRIKQVEENLGESIKTTNEPIRLLERMKEYNVPAVSIAVIKDFKLEWARAYGVIESGSSVNITTKTLFQAASISKSLNALGTLQLIQQKKLSIHTDINKYLKDWKFPYDSTKGTVPITVHHLLSHTAGLSVSGFIGYTQGQPLPSVIQILNGEKPAKNKTIKSLFNAGVKTQYSGGGITIVQKLIMDITEQPYDLYMKKNVLQPLKMKSSFFNTVPEERVVSTLASGHSEEGKPINGKFHFYPEQAAASLWTNPTELSKFIIDIQKTYNGEKGKVSTKAIADLMLKPVMAENALGTFIKTIGEDTYFNHGGANEGYRCFYIACAEKGYGVIVMINSNNYAIIPEIVNSVATVYNWKDYYKPIVRPTIKVPFEVLKSYEGTYEIKPDFTITIALNKYGLTAQATNQPAFKIFAESQNKFFLKVVDASIEFFKNDEGNVSKLELRQNGQIIEAYKR